jgi:hypothetical protein
MKTLSELQQELKDKPAKISAKQAKEQALKELEQKLDFTVCHAIENNYSKTPKKKSACKFKSAFVNTFTGVKKAIHEIRTYEPNLAYVFWNVFWIFILFKACVFLFHLNVSMIEKQALINRQIIEKQIATDNSTHSISSTVTDNSKPSSALTYADGQVSTINPKLLVATPSPKVATEPEQESIHYWTKDQH